VISRQLMPPEVEEAAARVLTGSSGPATFHSILRLGGGCIHPAAVVSMADGTRAFLKWSNERGFGGFGPESRGLQALARHGGVRTPAVLGVGEGKDSSPSWLLLEFVAEDAEAGRASTRLGRGLARLHRPLPDATPGWDESGMIGSLPQQNGFPRDTASWPEFWRERRLLPLWRRAGDRFPPTVHRGFDDLVSGIEAGLAGWEGDGLSVLHGDLWSGNVVWGPGGEPFLVDPAVYRGHREVDLAMMELFGDFDPVVLASYREEFPLLPGYAEVRRDIYQLYPLLVHVALFGESYRRGCEERIMRVVASLR